MERNRITGLRTGLTIVCAKREGRFVVRDNTVRGNSHAGVVARAHDVMLGRNTVEGNGTGILVERRASIRGTTVRGNRRAGISSSGTARRRSRASWPAATAVPASTWRPRA